MSRAALLVGGAALAAIAVDRVTKHAAEQHLPERVNVRGPFGITLRRVENGTYLHRDASASQRPLLAAGALLALGIAGTAIVLGRPVALEVGAGLLAGGMLSNVADRVRTGHVTDMLPTPLGVLNAADLAIAAGIVLAATGLAVRR